MMKTFWEYLNNDQINDLRISERPAPEPQALAPVASNANTEPINHTVAVPQPAETGFRSKVKPWKAKKSQIMTFWKALAPNIPLQLQPIEQIHKGSTLQQDTFRLTGSKEFITTVLSRLKDFVIYENPETKLVLDYRQNAKSLKPGEKNSYLFYLNVRKRK